MKMKVYGCRGSMPLCHGGSSLYGGNTACITLTSGKSTLILDAGSGIHTLAQEMGINDPSKYTDGIGFKSNILLGHLHVDHIIGLGTYAPAWEAGGETNVFTMSRNNEDLRKQIFGFFTPPYWPVTMHQVSHAAVTEIFPNKPFKIDDFTITPFFSCHGDLTLSFHITDGKKTVVYMLDSEISQMKKDGIAAVLKLCEDADLVVFDASYSDEDYEKLHKGWGHSTVSCGVRLAKKSSPKKILFSHFAQKYSDDELNGWTAKFDNSLQTEFIMAKDGLELNI